MPSRPSTGAALLRVALTALGLCAARAFAQGLVPAEIPLALPDAQKIDFQDKRAGLETRRAQLGAAVSLHNARCRGLPEDSPLLAECRTAQLELNASVASYRAALDDYNR